MCCLAVLPFFNSIVLRYKIALIEQWISALFTFFHTSPRRDSLCERCDFTLQPSVLPNKLGSPPIQGLPLYDLVQAAMVYAFALIRRV